MASHSIRPCLAFVLLVIAAQCDVAHGVAVEEDVVAMEGAESTLMAEPKATKVSHASELGAKAGAPHDKAGKAQKVLGEDAAFPGPFSPRKVDSDGTDGYVREMNHYNDVDSNTHGIDCGGNRDGGTTYVYPEPADGDAEDEKEPPDLTECRDLCNKCGTCVGFVDMIEERKCYFQSQLDYTEVKLGGGMELYRKYYNKVKTYEACPPGYWSVKEAERLPFVAGTTRSETCVQCDEGKYNSKETMNERCPSCDLGKISNYNIGVEVCQTCAAGKYSNPAGNPLYPGHAKFATKGVNCNSCTATSESWYSLEGKHFCTRCPKGTFGNKEGLTDAADTATGCRNCPKGKYTDMNGLLQCKECDPGTSANGLRRTGCKACVKGKYSVQTDEGAGAEVCTNCPDGQSSHRRAYVCYDCIPGRFAHGGWGSCRNCRKGAFAGPKATDCTKCLPGKATNQIRTEHDCPRCTPGKWQDQEGKLTCKACTQGKYQNEDGQIVCKDCAVGQHQDDSGMPACDNCAKGRWINEVGKVRCKNCAEGRHQDKLGKTDCKDCPTGRRMPSEEAVDCIACKPGRYQDATTKIECIDCAVGMFTRSAATVNCIDCAAGRFADVVGTLECGTCGAGYYADAAAKATGCLECAAGKSALSAQTECLDCEAGTFSGATQGECAECEKGMFQAATGKTHCDNCEPGKHASGKAQVVCADCANGKYAETGYIKCQMCQKGRFANTGAANSKTMECEKCAAGKFETAQPASECTACDVGSITSIVGQTVCMKCSHGKFMDEQGKAQCKDCEQGTHEAGQGSTACSDCGAGKYSEAAKNSCETCGETYFSAEKAASCTQCDSGKVSMANAAACVNCPAGKHTPYENEEEFEFLGESAGIDFNRLCKSCPAGKWSEPGEGCSDCALGQFSAGTETDCMDCHKGQYADAVGQTTCKQCPAGKIGGMSGLKGESQCTICPAGKHTHNADGKKSCDDCAGGKKSIGADNLNKECQNCATGRFSVDYATSRICTACQDGKTQAAQGATWCDHCGVGQFGATNAKTVACKPCVAGKYQDSGGPNIGCKMCQAGRYRSANDARRDECQSCPGNKYSGPNAGTHEGCSSCANGRVLVSQQSDVCAGGECRVDCNDCPAGTFKANNKACKTCPNGRHSTTKSHGRVSCQSCGKGKYSHQKNDGVCQWCPDGKYNNLNKNTGTGVGAGCKSCWAGRSQNSARKGCSTCPNGLYTDGWAQNCRVPGSGHISVNGLRESCPSGTYQDVTNAAASSCKSCSELGTNKYNNAQGQNTCSTCPSGQSADSGTSYTSCLAPPGKVTCDLTIDNAVTGVFWNGAALSTTSGTWNNWSSKKTTAEFTDESGVLAVRGYEYSNCDGCGCSGLTVHCTADDHDSPWHNFVSTKQNVYAWGSSSGSTSTSVDSYNPSNWPGTLQFSGAGTPCQSTSGYSLSGYSDNKYKVWSENGSGSHTGEKYAWFTMNPYLYDP